MEPERATFHHRIRPGLSRIEDGKGTYGKNIQRKISINSQLMTLDYTRKRGPGNYNITCFNKVEEHWGLHFVSGQYPSGPTAQTQMSHSQLPAEPDPQDPMRLQRESFARMAKKPLLWLKGFNPNKMTENSFDPRTQAEQRDLNMLPLCSNGSGLNDRILRICSAICIIKDCLLSITGVRRYATSLRFHLWYPLPSKAATWSRPLAFTVRWHTKTSELE